MPSDRSHWSTRALALVCAWLSIFIPVPWALANPENGQVLIPGSATIETVPGTVTIHQTAARTAIRWDRFNIAAGELTKFDQVSANAVAFNRIVNGGASSILGRLEANGHVYLINPAGIVFGRGAVVDTQGLVAATQFDASRYLDADTAAVVSSTRSDPRFDPTAAINNDGTIRGGKDPSAGGGLVALVAPQVNQTGTIKVVNGRVLLAAGATATLTDASGLSFAFENPNPAGGAPLDLGEMVAADGVAALRSAVVRQSGSIEASGAAEQGGEVRLVGKPGEVQIAGGRVELGPGARFDADRLTEIQAADRIEVTPFANVALAGGNAKSVTRLRSAGDISFGRNARISDAPGGDGGSVDLVAGAELREANPANEKAPIGRRAGASGSVLLSGGFYDPTSGIRTQEAENGGEVALGKGQIRVRAAGDLLLGNGGGLATRSGRIDADALGSVRFRASAATPNVTTRIETETGNIRVVAGDSVDLTDGGRTGNAAIRSRGERVEEKDAQGTSHTFIRNKGGGNILVWAKNGDVDSGVTNRWLEPGPVLGGTFEELKTQGVDLPNFDPTPVHKSGILGIGSEAGSDVTVVAGGNIQTRLPTASDQFRSGGSASGLEVQEDGRTALPVRDGSHIGVFGEEREIMSASELAAVYLEDPTKLQPLEDTDTGPIPIELQVPDPGSRPAKLTLVAGGNLVGDVMMRNGKAVLRAGYALKDKPRGDLATQDTLGDGPIDGLLDPSAVSDAQPPVGDPSGAKPFDRGWMGTLSNPLTVDLVRASVDMKGRNGVVLRAIENPSLVYPDQAGGRNGRVSTYGQADEAIVEAERGDIVLLGTDTELLYPENHVPKAKNNSLVRHLPPRVKFRTNVFQRGGETRGGDFVQLNDFQLEPSPQGNVDVDIQGEIRTASGFGAGQAALSIDVVTKGKTAQNPVHLEPGLKLIARDPKHPGQTIGLTVGGAISVDAVAPAQPSTGDVRFFVDAKSSRDGLLIPPGKYDPKTGTCTGTCVVGVDGKIYEVTGTSNVDAALKPAAERFSLGKVTFSLKGPTKTGVSIEKGALFEYRFKNAQGQTEVVQFQTKDLATIRPGTRSAEAQVVALNPGRDAPAGKLQLVRASIPKAPAGLRATNLGSTVRPPWVDLGVTNVLVGKIGNTKPLTITALLKPVAGVTRVINQEDFGKGRNASDIGALVEPVIADADVQGPRGLLPTSTLLVAAPGALPSSIPAGEIEFRVQAISKAAVTVAGVYRDLVVERSGTGPSDPVVRTRVDPASSTSTEPPLADPATTYTKAPSSDDRVASLTQSDADPQIDRRGAALDYYAYYQSCRAGTACDVEGAPARREGAKPTHFGRSEVARIMGRAGIRNIVFDLAMPATMFGESLFDVGLLTQHSRAEDVSQIVVPRGNAVFGAQSNRSGFVVGGPGLARVLVGVVPHTTRLGGFGETPPTEIEPANGFKDDPDPNGISREEFKFDGSPEEKDAIYTALDDRNGPEEQPDGDGALSAREAPFVPSGAPDSGSLQLDKVKQGLGIITTGNLRDGALPAGGARLQVVVAKTIDLGTFGTIGTLQGGDVRVTSVGGGLKGGEVPVGTLNKRGIFSVFTRLVGGTGAEALPTGAGNIFVDTHGEINPGGLPIVSLSGGNILIESRDGDVTFGKGAEFSNVTVGVALDTGLPILNYLGAGLASPNGAVKVKTRKNINLGAGLRARSVNLDAGQNINQGTGGVSAENIQLSAGDSISGSFNASGNISVGSGTVSGSANVSAGGFVGGGGAAGGGSNAAKVGGETVARSREAPVVPSGLAGFGGGATRSVLIDVSSRPCRDDECEGR